MKALRIWAIIMALISVLIIVTSCVFINGKDSSTETEPAETESETEAVINLTEEERQLMARVLFNEAGANSIKLMEYCASVMLNQLFSGWYGDTITEVLSRKNTDVGYAVLDTDADNSKGADLSTVLAVVDEICSTGSILPETIWFFRAGEPFSWEGLETFEIVEGVYFQYFDAAHVAAGWH